MSHRVLRAAAWVLSLRMLGRAATIVRTFVLVRLLTPHDFGLVGMAVAVIACAEALSNTGVHLALLGRHDDSREEYDSAWSIGVIRGAAVTAVLLLVAPVVAAFFGAEDATGILRLMALAPLIDGLGNIGVIEYRRDASFGPYNLLHAAGEAADLAVAIPLALMTRSAWAMAWAWIALWVVRTAVSYVIHPYRPRFRIDPVQARALLRYSGHVTSASGVSWLLGGGVEVTIGRILGVEALGLFRMAKLVAGVLPTEIAGVIAWVAVGTLAKLNASADRLRSTVLDLLWFTVVPAVPFCVGTLLFAPEIVAIGLGPRWAGIVPAVRVMAVLGLMRSLTAVAVAVFQGRGVPRYQTYATLVELALVLGCLWAMATWAGLVGATVAVTLGAAAAVATALPMMRRMASVGVRDVAMHLAIPFIASSPFIAIRLVADPVHSVPGFALVVFTSAAVYVAGLMWLEHVRLAPVGLLYLVHRWSGGRGAAS